MDNYKSAFENRDVVEKQIKEEIIEGLYLTCSKPATIVSALGAIPKADGGIRLIYDCSQPCVNVLNDYATNESKIKYQTIKDAVKLLKPEGYMAKVDLKSAYRSVALHLSQYEYTGLKWTFNGDGNLLISLTLVYVLVPACRKGYFIASPKQCLG